MGRLRLAILGSHPIPYHAPLYRSLAKRADIEILVFYGDVYGVRPRYSAWGVQDFTWKTNITEGYPHVFLRNYSPRPNPSSFMGKLNPYLIPAMHKFRPDAILLMGYAGVFQMQGILGAIIQRIPILFLADSNSLAESPKGIRGWMKPRVLKRLYNRFAAFLVIGERNREYYKMYGVPEQRMFSFPYAVDNEFFAAEAKRLRTQRSSLREKFGIPTDSVCVVYSGRLAPGKNIEELMHSLAPLPGFHLLIVGDGPERKSLEALAMKAVPGRHTFAGFLNQDQLSEAYTAADVFALTSRYEPWGLVCNEAMNFGLPLVLSDRVGACADLVVEGETGWSYPIGDIDALARVLDEAGQTINCRRSAIAETVMRRVSLFNFQSQAEGVVNALYSVAGKDKIIDYNHSLSSIESTDTNATCN